jgi:hypothetical protein
MRQSGATGAEILVPADTAWLLQCLIHCTRKNNGAALRDIVAFGDFINHAVFEYTEFCSALAFLMAARIAFVRHGRIYLTKNFRTTFLSITTQPKRPAYAKEYTALERYLFLSRPSSMPLQAPMAKAVFSQAVSAYLASAGLGRQNKK